MTADLKLIEKVIFTTTLKSKDEVAENIRKLSQTERTLIRDVFKQVLKKKVIDPVQEAKAAEILLCVEQRKPRSDNIGFFQRIKRCVKTAFGKRIGGDEIMTQIEKLHGGHPLCRYKKIKNVFKEIEQEREINPSYTTKKFLEEYKLTRVDLLVEVSSVIKGSYTERGTQKNQIQEAKKTLEKVKPILREFQTLRQNFQSYASRGFDDYQSYLKLTDTIELLSELFFKTYNLPVKMNSTSLPKIIELINRRRDLEGSCSSQVLEDFAREIIKFASEKEVISKTEIKRLKKESDKLKHSPNLAFLDQRILKPVLERVLTHIVAERKAFVDELRTRIVHEAATNKYEKRDLKARIAECAILEFSYETQRLIEDKKTEIKEIKANITAMNEVISRLSVLKTRSQSKTNTLRKSVKLCLADMRRKREGQFVGFIQELEAIKKIDNDFNGNSESLKKHLSTDGIKASKELTLGIKKLLKKKTLSRAEFFPVYFDVLIEKCRRDMAVEKKKIESANGVIDQYRKDLKSVSKNTTDIAALIKEIRDERDPAKVEAKKNVEEEGRKARAAAEKMKKEREARGTSPASSSNSSAPASLSDQLNNIADSIKDMKELDNHRTTVWALIKEAQFRKVEKDIYNALYRKLDKKRWPESKRRASREDAFHRDHRTVTNKMRAAAIKEVAKKLK